MPRRYGAWNDLTMTGTKLDLAPTTRGPARASRRQRRAGPLNGPVLEEIRSGAFAEEFIGDIKAGGPRMQELRAKAKGSQIETVGKELRGMMPFVSGGKRVTRRAIDPVCQEPRGSWHTRHAPRGTAKYPACQ